MGYQDEVSADIARLREIGATGAAFHMARMAAEIIELRRRNAELELAVSCSSVPACQIDLAAISCALRTVMEEFERLAPEVVRRSDACQGRHLKAVR